MELYGATSKSIPQKIIIICLEVIFLWISYWILFQNGGTIIYEYLGISDVIRGVIERRIIVFVFSVIVFLRMGFMMFYLLKRKIPWEEAFTVPFAFALYYIGFALLVYGTTKPIGWIDFLAILLFIGGSFINTYAEWQRHLWKKCQENRGRLYTQGLFKYAMHINYFGDILWVIAYALITRNYYSVFVPVFLCCFFAFYNIPKLDEYLSNKYRSAFELYKKKTKKLIPFIY